MRKFLVLAVACAMAASMVAAPAQAQSLSKKVAELSRQVKQLTRQVNGLNGTVNADHRTLACMHEFPITQYGDKSGSFGYPYYFTGVGNPLLTTALDVTETGGSVSAWVLTDGCNSQTVARRTGAAASGTFTPAAISEWPEATK